MRPCDHQRLDADPSRAFEAESESEAFTRLVGQNASRVSPFLLPSPFSSTSSSFPPPLSRSFYAQLQRLAIEWEFILTKLE